MTKRSLAGVGVAACLLIGSLLPTVAAGGERPGLYAEFWDLTGKDVTDYPVITPDMTCGATQVDPVLDFPSTSETFDGTPYRTHFYARWTGRLTILNPGRYTFYTDSDDGSRLFIDEEQVLDNAGLHGMVEKAGEISLAAGPHSIRIEFFQNEGPCGFRLLWSAAGMDKKIIPAEVLSCDPAGPGRNGTTVAVDDSVVELEHLPPPKPGTKPAVAVPTSTAAPAPAAPAKPAAGAGH